MRKNIVCIVVLFCTLSLHAVEYGTMYQGRTRNRLAEPAYSIGGYNTMATGEMTTYGEESAIYPNGRMRTAYYIGGYSTIAIGGMTTNGEGSAIHPRGPRRTAYTTAPSNPQEGDTWTDAGGVTRTWMNGKWYVWNSDKQVWEDEDGNPFYKDAGEPLPIGSSIPPLLLMALILVATIYIKQRRKITTNNNNNNNCK